MKISVIMSVYNCAGTVKESIESVLSQTFRDFEFIIVNDGSIDDTDKIIGVYRELDARIVVIEHKNQGLTRSLNIALGKARGEYIARQDADDVSLPQRFQRQVQFLDAQNRIGFVGCNYGLIDKEGRVFDFGPLEDNPAKIVSRLGKKNFFCHGTVLFRREVLEKVGGYRDFFRYAQDYDLYLRLIEFTLPGSLNKVLYYRRVLLDSISVSKSRLQAAYAELARKSCEERRALRDDSLILKEEALDNLVTKSGLGDSGLYFLEAFYRVKNNDTDRARQIIRPHLFPASLLKCKFYALWIFSYFPGWLRNASLYLKANIRRVKLLTDVCK